MTTEKQAISILKKEFEKGPWKNNTIKDKARRFLEIETKEVHFSQTKFDDITYPYRHEIRVCLMHGEFFASISLCGVLIERVLSIKLEERTKLVINNFNTLIDVCHAFEILDDELKEKAHRIRKIRNSIVHPSETKFERLSKGYDSKKDTMLIEQIAFESYDNMNDILAHLYPLD